MKTQSELPKLYPNDLQRSVENYIAYCMGGEAECMKVALGKLHQAFPKEEVDNEIAYQYEERHKFFENTRQILFNFAQQCGDYSE